MGYKFQFITLAGFHALNYSMFELCPGLQGAADDGVCGAAAGGVRRRVARLRATKHQREVGAGYFDDVTQTVTAGTSSITALTGSTEEQQFR
jgi:isocitrate lyase